MNAAQNTSKVILVNNSGADIRPFDAHFIAAVRRGDGVLPEELADLFSVTIILADDGLRGIVEAL